MAVAKAKQVVVVVVLMVLVLCGMVEFLHCSEVKFTTEGESKIFLLFCRQLHN